jgi:hypothetical protein
MERPLTTMKGMLILVVTYKMLGTHKHLPCHFLKENRNHWILENRSVRDLLMTITEIVSQRSFFLTLMNKKEEEKIRVKILIRVRKVRKLQNHQ